MDAACLVSGVPPVAGRGAARLADRLLLLNERDRDMRSPAAGSRRIGSTSSRMASPTFLAADPGADAPRGEGLLFCGSWDHVKGRHYLVQAFEQLHASDPRAPLTVLGPGVPAEMVLAAFPARVRPARARRSIAGPRMSSSAPTASHDVLLWPSTYEGSGWC